MATDIDAWSPAVHVADRARRVPRSDARGYVEALLDICVADDIGLLVPTIDDELELLACAASRFAAEVSRSRHQMWRRRGFARTSSAPRHTWRSTASGPRAHGRRSRSQAQRSSLPCSSSPDAAVGASAPIPSPPPSRRFFLGYVPDPVVQEYLDGSEYTIDLFCDLEGRPIAAGPRERLVVRLGVTDRGQTSRDPTLIGLAVRCAAVLRFKGAVNVQCRVVRGTPVVFEINPRFSGGIQLTIAAGADFAEWTIRMARGESLRPCLGQFTDGLRMSSYESSLFLTASDASRLATPDQATEQVP